jgi:uncharacterized repeat protein (TIGR04076 family)
LTCGSLSSESKAGRCADSRSAITSRIAAALPLLAAKQRKQPAGDWLEQDSLVACPDPDERLVMRIDRIRRRRIPTEALT